MYLISRGDYTKLYHGPYLTVHVEQACLLLLVVKNITKDLKLVRSPQNDVAAVLSAIEEFSDTLC